METLPPGESFLFNYQPSRIDRNALYAMNQVFSKDKVSEVRTKYHRAKLNLEDLKSDLMEYAVPKAHRTHTNAYYAAVQSVIEDLEPSERLIPLTHGAVTKHENFPSTKSAGLPYKQMGIPTKGDAISNPDTLLEIQKEWYAIEAGHDVELPDAAVFARAQICSRDTNKIRATWGYPLSVYLTEGQYFYPILEHLKNLPNPIIAYGVEIGNGGMEFINSMTEVKGSYLIGDWKRFDKTIPAWLIRDAFKVLETWIDFTKVRDSEGNIWPVREYRSRRRWRKLVDYFIMTPCRLSNGERFRKIGGVPSGSCFTNVIDSIINAIVMRYLVYQLTGDLPLADIYLGDDSCLFLAQPINMDEFAELAKEQFSMIFNVDKSYITTNPANIHFLGYLNFQGYPAKPADTIVASTIYPERPVRNKLETISRLIGQAYSCFDPHYASCFFKAANILIDEEAFELSFVESIIHDHPQWFKYLQTLGIDPRTIRIVRPKHDDLVLITSPGPCRRKWKFRMRDPHALFLQFQDREWDEEDDAPDSNESGYVSQ
uniref:RdRp n=1 Tax=Hubei partiti-like virus 4 TaxID=1923047 RepID=A0A1L3KLG9_9VIRU|nr:RdRp [Hubei partiti-like virus 4]